MQVFSLAQPAQCMAAHLAIRPICAVPYVQCGEKITGLVGVAVVDAIRILALLLGAFTRILQAQERHDDEHGGQGVRCGGAGGLDHHTAQTHVNRYARKLAPGVRQLHDAAFARSHAIR